MSTQDTNRTLDIDLERPRLISWAAVFAGLFVVVGVSWLLSLLGAAVGVSVADLTDGGAIGDGLGIGAMIWIVLTPCAAFFVGSMLASRLSGKTEDTVGILHGITLWGAATTLMIVLGFSGLSRVVQTGQSVVTAAGSAVASATDSVAGAAHSAAQNTAQAAAAAAQAAADSPLSDTIQARLKREASALIADMEAEGGASIDAEEIRTAIDRIDQQTFTEIARALINGDIDQAENRLQSASGLSDDQVAELAEGLSTEVQQLLGTADNQQGLVADVTNTVRDRASAFVANLDSPGGANITQADIRAAINDLDAAVLQKVGLRLIQGETQAAKDVLTANTPLSDAQVNEIITSVERDLETELDEWQQAATDAAEIASDYVVAATWSAFGVAALSLIISILGGWLGTESTRQIEIRHARVGQPH
ncbi:MAG: hypothetical protein AAGF47_09675 [Planctomycetota bacterium]